MNFGDDSVRITEKQPCGQNCRRAVLGTQETAVVVVAAGVVAAGAFFGSSNVRYCPLTYPTSCKIWILYQSPSLARICTCSPTLVPPIAS